MLLLPSRTSHLAQTSSIRLSSAVKNVPILPNVFSHAVSTGCPDPYVRQSAFLCLPFTPFTDAGTFTLLPFFCTLHCISCTFSDHRIRPKSAKRKILCFSFVVNLALSTFCSLFVSQFLTCVSKQSGRPQSSYFRTSGATNLL